MPEQCIDISRSREFGTFFLAAQSIFPLNKPQILIQLKTGLHMGIDSRVASIFASPQLLQSVIDKSNASIL